MARDKNLKIALSPDTHVPGPAIAYGPTSNVILAARSVRSPNTIRFVKGFSCMSHPLPRAPDTQPDHAPPGFHLLAKPSGSTCNIDCTYCFFLSKEALYPDDTHRMSESTHDTYIRQLL